MQTAFNMDRYLQPSDLSLIELSRLVQVIMYCLQLRLVESALVCKRLLEACLCTHSPTLVEHRRHGQVIIKKQLCLLAGHISRWKPSSQMSPGQLLLTTACLTLTLVLLSYISCLPTLLGLGSLIRSLGPAGPAAPLASILCS